MTANKTVSLKDVEALLTCLPGVQKARVVINDWGAIEEIHILTGLSRNPKQIVRDVESALKAQWNITIDRRKVSVAQIQARLPGPPARLRYSGLEIRTDAKEFKNFITVTLERQLDEESAVFVGKAHSNASEYATLLGIAKATCLAVNMTLDPSNSFFPDDVHVMTIGSYSAVIVLLNLLTPRRNHEELLGAALVRKVRESCVRATLDAMNRRLDVLLQKPSGLIPKPKQPQELKNIAGRIPGYKCNRLK